MPVTLVREFEHGRGETALERLAYIFYGHGRIIHHGLTGWTPPVNNSGGSFKRQKNGGNMKNPLAKLFGIVLLSIVLLFLGRDAIVKASVGSVCRATTGLRLSIGGFHSNLFSSTLDIRNLKLFNPRGYTEKIMFDIPQVRVGLDVGSILAGKPHLKEVNVHLAQIVIERNKEGKLNLAELKPAGGKKKSAESKPSSAPTVSVDLLHLQIDKVLYKDFSKPIPFVQEFQLDIDETYRDVKDVKALVPIIIGNALKNQALRGLLNFNVSDLLQNFEAGGMNIADLGLDKISGVFDSGIGQTAQGILGSVKDQLGSIFSTS